MSYFELMWTHKCYVGLMLFTARQQDAV